MLQETVPKIHPRRIHLAAGDRVSPQRVHWIDPSSPEFNQKPFSITFIYGSYNGQMTFIEPMMTMAFLETKPEISAPIKLPAAYQKRGYHPTANSVKYDTVRKNTRYHWSD